MKTLYVMDPLSSLHLEGDSTYMMMLEANRRGYSTYWCTPKDLFALGGQSYARATHVKVSDTEPCFDESEPQDINLGTFDVIWMRKDPPFNMDYIFSTYLLDLVPPSTLVLNDPRAIRNFQRKDVRTSLCRVFASNSCYTRDFKSQGMGQRLHQSCH